QPTHRSVPTRLSSDVQRDRDDVSIPSIGWLRHDHRLYDKAPPRADHDTLSLHDALPIYPHVSDAESDQDRHRRATSLVGQLSRQDRKSTRLNSSHVKSSYAVFCLKKKTGRFSITMLDFHSVAMISEIGRGHV